MTEVGLAQAAQSQRSQLLGAPQTDCRSYAAAAHAAVELAHYIHAASSLLLLQDVGSAEGPLAAKEDPAAVCRVLQVAVAVGAASPGVDVCRAEVGSRAAVGTASAVAVGPAIAAVEDSIAADAAAGDGKAGPWV